MKQLNNATMKRYLPFIFIVIFFILIKLPNQSIRLSDTNIYFYTGYQLLQGKILYKDLFFTNFPLFPYLSSLYFLLLQGNLQLFYITSLIEIIATGFLLYKIILKKTNQLLVTTACIALYFFSFIILTTSDHQTGVFAASFFIVLSYYFFDQKQYLKSGIFASLALLTKAYFLPLPVGFFCYLILKKQYIGIKQFLLGSIVTFLLILTPSLLFARKEFITDVFLYSLTRGAGTVKGEIAWFFVSHDIIFFVLLLFSLFIFRKQQLFTLITCFSLLFFFFYQDIYYLYLNFIIPFLILVFPHAYMFLQEKFRIQKMIIPTIIIFISIFNIFLYLTSYKSLQTIQNLKEITSLIHLEKPPFLYGTNDITPALSYLTGVPLLNTLVDTNENIYRKNFLDAKQLTQDAINKKAIIISHGVYYPSLGVQEDVLDGIFVKKLIAEHCTLLKRFPVKAEGLTNTLTLFRCF